MTVSTLTLLVLRIGFLLLLWVFVFAIVYSLRSDLFGPRTRKPQAGANQQARPAPSAPQPPIPTPTGQTDTSYSDSPLAGLARAQTGPVSSPSFDDDRDPFADRDHGQPGAPRPNRPMATVLTASKLVITNGSRRDTAIELGTEPITIGRSGDSGLVIRDDYTSTHHARLMLWNDEWMIQDLDSTNGTFLDGRRVHVPTQVPLDAPIKIGTTTFELRR